MTFLKFYKPLLLLALLLNMQLVFAGAPFSTDDPVPVDYKHVEIYLASSHSIDKKFAAGNIFNFETNYGLIPNMQVHILLPLNYSYEKTAGLKVGYANTEFGVKYRFIQETDKMPQVAIYPTLEIPTIENEEFGDGTIKLFLPLWLQKSWGKFTSYGGGGYWINPGIGNKNYCFFGLEGQYQISTHFACGGEVFGSTPDVKNGDNSLAFNIGGICDISDKFHILFSGGHSLVNDNEMNLFISFLITP